MLREGSERWCREGLGLFAFFSNMERSVNYLGTLLGEGGQVSLVILSLEYVAPART